MNIEYNIIKSRKLYIYVFDVNSIIVINNDK